MVQTNVPNFCVHDRILYFHPAGEKGLDQRVYVPYSLRVRVINEFHKSSIQGAHAGVSKTISKLKSRFYWPGQTEDVARGCGPCQFRKTNPAQVSHEPL